METIVLLPHTSEDTTSIVPSTLYAVHAIPQQGKQSCLLGNTHVGYVAQRAVNENRVKGTRSTALWGFTEQLEDFRTAEFVHQTAQEAADALREQQNNVIVYSVN